MYLELMANVARLAPPERHPLLATFVVGDERFAVEIGGARDAAQIERLVAAAVRASLTAAGLAAMEKSRAVAKKVGGLD